MSNRLKQENKIRVISALCEGVSIRAVERMTGVHRDTIMRLGVRVGQACAREMDARMRNLNCKDIQCDEIWGFVGKKQRNAKRNEKHAGDYYTFVALDRDSKLVPCHSVGRRTNWVARNFILDLSSRLTQRIQLSTDAFVPYIDAIERGFGDSVDYGQIMKSRHTDYRKMERRYSPGPITEVKREALMGKPKKSEICTSHVEAQNLTMRMHIRRLTRLTNAFSKKLENFQAAVALHFAYYNLVKTHITIRCTPAMAAGVVQSSWTVADLVALSEAL